MRVSLQAKASQDTGQGINGSQKHVKANPPRSCTVAAVEAHASSFGVAGVCQSVCRRRREEVAAAGRVRLRGRVAQEEREAKAKGVKAPGGVDRDGSMLV